MKAKFILLSSIISAGLLAASTAWAAGPRGNRAGCARGVPATASVRQGPGQTINGRANSSASCIPLRDGSGRANGARGGPGSRAGRPGWFRN